MAKVIITKALEERINKIFKKESIKIFSLLSSLQDNPKKGKEVGVVGSIVLKEIKYRKYRFYFITIKPSSIELHGFSINYHLFF